MDTTKPQASQLAHMFRALAHPLRVELITIISNERIASIPTLQHHLPTIDPFRLYSNLRYMHERKVIRKVQKGREIYYGLSEEAVAARLDIVFGAASRLADV